MSDYYINTCFIERKSSSKFWNIQRKIVISFKDIAS